MQCVRDRVIPVKLASERALVHILCIQSDPSVLTEYLSTLDSANSRSVGDYARRVLSKIAEASSEIDEEHETDDVLFD
jgi:hypothetical protein